MGGGGGPSIPGEAGSVAVVAGTHEARPRDRRHVKLGAQPSDPMVARIGDIYASASIQSEGLRPPEQGAEARSPVARVAPDARIAGVAGHRSNDEVRGDSPDSPVAEVGDQDRSIRIDGDVDRSEPT